MTIGPNRACARFSAHLALVLIALAGPATTTRARQAPTADLEKRPGQRFLVEEPINTEALTSIRDAARQLLSRTAKEGRPPVLVFEFRPGKVRPGGSDFGTSYDLARFIASDLGGAMTVGYVPEPLKGYATLPALACDEIVMGSAASIGPITPEGQAANAGFRSVVRDLAINKGRDPGLFLGLLDRDAELRAIRTVDRQLHYVMEADLPEFAKTHQIVSDASAWAGGQRGVLAARRARDEHFAKLLSDDIREIADNYRLSGGLSSDPTLLAEPKAVWIRVVDQIDATKERFIAQRIARARSEGMNLVFLEINSDGGLDLAASNIAQALAEVKDMKTVAYVDDRALGVAALIPLACDDIVLRKGARIGKVTHVLSGRESVPLTRAQVSALASLARTVSEAKAHPPALAEAMVDPGTVLVSAKNTNTAAPTFATRDQVEADPAKYVDVVTIKDAGSVLTLTADEVVSDGLGQRVADKEDLKSLYRLRGKTIREDGPTWVDGLVHALNQPFISFLLLFVGVFMMILEIKMPGVGLPAITSVLAFLLFFWSRFLSGTADQLEILLFLVGLVCMGLELFVFPGFGVFGVSGVLLILASIVMASHTFIWPTQEYEYRQMLSTLFQVTAVLVSVGAGVAVVGRFLPSIPLFNKMILRPEPWDASAGDDPMHKPTGEIDSPFGYLLGETGRTTSILRPTGKARFGDVLVDVSADGFYLDPGTLVEVIDVQGTRVIVRPVR